MVRNVCLQINLAPVDMRFVAHTLPHQMRMLGGQVEKIQLTIDPHNSRAGRFSTENHTGKLGELRRYLQLICGEFPHAEIVEVNYDKACVREVGQAFIGKDVVPMKAYGGSPIYPYLYGLFRSRCDYVFHTDSDMLYGGGSQTWILEAVKVLEANRGVLACNPLGGPPRRGESEPAPPGYYFNEISTRVFILDRRRFLSGEFKIPMVRSSARQNVQAFLNNTSPYLNLEDSVTALMRTNDLRRFDFLGSGPGLWTLHPPHRSELFFAELPELVRRVECNDIPDGQIGDYDLNDSMIDWSDARRRGTVKHRSYRQLRLAAVNIPERIRSTWYKLTR